MKVNGKECKWQRDDSMQNASSNYNLINKLTVFLVSSSLMCSTGFNIHLSRILKHTEHTFCGSGGGGDDDGDEESKNRKKSTAKRKQGKPSKKIDSTNRLQ